MKKKDCNTYYWMQSILNNMKKYPTSSSKITKNSLCWWCFFFDIHTHYLIKLKENIYERVFSSFFNNKLKKNELTLCYWCLSTQSNPIQLQFCLPQNTDHPCHHSTTRGQQTTSALNRSWLRSLCSSKGPMK